MKTSLLVLIATLALLLGLCQSQLESTHRTEIALDRRQAGDFDAEFPEYVYRGETGRSPADVEKDGGLYSRGVQKQRAGTALSAVELQEGSSLFHHAAGETAEFTRYVSTSADPGVGLTFAVNDDVPEQKGYIYRIHTDKRMVDVNRSLGKYSPYAAQKEHAAIGFIPYDQIEGWWEVTYKDDFSDPKIGKQSQEKLRQGKFKGFKKNPKFNKGSFQKLRGTGAAPQLAGFPRLSPAWQDDTWKAFKTQAVEKNLDDLISSICAGKSTKRDAGCMTRLGHQETTGLARPKPPKKPSTASNPDGKPPKSKVSSKRPIYKSSKVRVTKAVGKAAAFTLILPYARDLLEAIKQWDNPIGAAVRWFDDAIASIQEAIGGPSRDDIDGNDLKASIICALKGGRESETIQGRKSHFCTPTKDEFTESLQRDFKKGRIDELIQGCRGVDVYNGGDPHVWRWSQRRCEALQRTDEYAERIWEMGLTGLLDSCSELETNPPGNEDLRIKLEDHCTAFQDGVERAEKAAKKPVVGIPKITAGKCKCDAYHLQPFSEHCGRLCRASYALGGWGAL
ncbi:heat-labile enterotoxin alpha chain [Metarhizium robertsii]|uniref:Heat-labile enterotoxin alpha chain n=1 Tax=Metarhizium robertsii TaxID=568076 RepID=A0A014MZ40_9HYPO|nr:heat-labile enterotoxin alpha chain [Metarhizium robertsii]